MPITDTARRPRRPSRTRAEATTRSTPLYLFMPEFGRSRSSSATRRTPPLSCSVSRAREMTPMRRIDTLVLPVLLPRRRRPARAPGPPSSRRDQLLDRSPARGATRSSSRLGRQHARVRVERSGLPGMEQARQRETNGSLGKFCVNCHAPWPSRRQDPDGLNLEQLEDGTRA